MTPESDSKQLDRQGFLLLLDELMELPGGSLRGPEKLTELEGWSSIAMVSFIALVDEHFQLPVSPRELRKCQTIDDLIGLVGPLNGMG